MPPIPNLLAADTADHGALHDFFHSGASGLLLEGVRLSAAGLLLGWLAGVMYAVYLLFAKSLRGLHVRSTPVVFAQSAFTALAMVVPGLLAVGAAHYEYAGTDLDPVFRQYLETTDIPVLELRRRGGELEAFG